jgi:hypothetical protein
MRKHTLLASLYVFVVLTLLAVPSVYSQTATKTPTKTAAPTVAISPSFGVGISAAGNMDVDNPDIAVQGGVMFQYGVILSQHTVQFDTIDNVTGGDNHWVLGYDGNVMFERKFGALAYGVGLQTTVSANPIHTTTWAQSVTRPYLVVARRVDEAMATVKFILPGNDGWRDQFGMQGSVEVVMGHHLTASLTAGAYSYHETEAGLVPFFQSQGVIKYTYENSPRKLGAAAGITLKYYLR